VHNTPWFTRPIFISSCQIIMVRVSLLPSELSASCHPTLCFKSTIIDSQSWKTFLKGEDTCSFYKVLLKEKFSPNELSVTNGYYPESLDPWTQSWAHCPCWWGLLAHMNNQMWLLQGINGQGCQGTYSTEALSIGFVSDLPWTSAKY
jgi:hypothetical protein